MISFGTTKHTIVMEVVDHVLWSVVHLTITVKMMSVAFVYDSSFIVKAITSIRATIITELVEELVTMGLHPYRSSGFVCSKVSERMELIYVVWRDMMDSFVPGLAGFKQNITKSFHGESLMK
jgi:hypothetical protein